MAEYAVVTIEMKLNDIWTDITADVVGDCDIQYGIMDNDVMGRVADPGSISFMLNNSANNSATKEGYYSPGHANARSGFNIGTEVRLKVVYDGFTMYKFKGKIPEDGILVLPGIYGPRYTGVMAYDYMDEVFNEDIDLPELQTNKRMNEIVEQLVANMQIQPESTDYDQGQDIYSTVFDTVSSGTTKVASEFQKVAMCEYGYIYVKRDGTAGEILRVEGRYTRTGSDLLDLPVCTNESNNILDSDDNNILDSDGEIIVDSNIEDAEFDDMVEGLSNYSWGKSIVNRVFGTVYPRYYDTSYVALFELRDPIYIEGKSTKENLRGIYKDPNNESSKITATDLQIPVANTDYTFNSLEDGTGSDLTEYMEVTTTLGADQADISIYNTGNTPGYVTKFQIRGKGIYYYDQVSIKVEDQDSIDDNGIMSLRVNLMYQDDVVEGEGLANMIKETYKDPIGKFEQIGFIANKDGKHMFAFLLAEPGDMIKLTEELTGENAQEYFINGVSGKISSGANGQIISYQWVLAKKTQVTFWKLGASGYSELQTAGSDDGTARLAF